MRKLLAAFLVAALSLLSFTAPAQADENPFQSDDVGLRAAQIFAEDWDFRALEEAQWDALEMVEGTVSGPFREQYGDIWVSPGAKLEVKFDRAPVVGETRRCVWVYETDISDEPVATENDCSQPLITTNADAGRYYYTFGWYETFGEITAILVSDYAPRVAAYSTNVSVALKNPSTVFVQEENSFGITVTWPTGDNRPEFSEWRARVIRADGSVVEELYAGNSVVLGESLNYYPHQSLEGDELNLEVIVHSDTYEPVRKVISLGASKSNLPRQELRNKPVIKIYGAYAHVSNYGATNVYDDRGFSIAVHWYVDGKLVGDNSTSAGLQIIDDFSGIPVVAKVTYKAYNFRNLTVESNTLVFPKVDVPFDSSNSGYQGKFVVGSTVSVVGVETKVKDSKIDFQWLKNGEPISGATGKNLSIKRDLLHSNIGVEVTVSSPNYKTQTFALPWKFVERGSLKITKMHSVTGNAVVGSTLKVVPGQTSPNASNVRYYWSSGRKSLTKDGAEQIRLTPEMVGQNIRIRMYAKKSGYDPALKDIYTVTIGKSTASVKAKLSKKRIKANGSSKLAVTVKTPGVAKPTGKVTVKVGKKTYKATLKASQKGKVSLTLKGLKVGKGQAVKVKFTPTGKTAKAVKSSKNTTVAKIAVKKVSKTVAR